MKKVYYEKIGRTYKPVCERDPDLYSGFTKGSHLVVCNPGGRSTRYNVNPNFVALIAAGLYFEDTVSKKIVESSKLRLQNKDCNRELTPKQKLAWENLVEAFGDSARVLEYPSAREIAEEGVKVLIEEANKLMTNPAVKKAYEQFLLVCELTKDEN